MNEKKETREEVPIALEFAKERYPGEPFLVTDQITPRGYIIRDKEMLIPTRELDLNQTARILYGGKEPLLATDIITPDGYIVRNGNILHPKS